METGRVQIFGDPGVKIFTIDGKQVDEINESGVWKKSKLPVGPITYLLKREGFAPLQVDGVVRAGDVLRLDATMKVFKPPVEGSDWENSLKMKFAWVDGAGHVARFPVSPELYEEYRAATKSDQPFQQWKVMFPDPELSAPVDAMMVTKRRWR